LADREGTACVQNAFKFNKRRDDKNEHIEKRVLYVLRMPGNRKQNELNIHRPKRRQIFEESARDA
jgi:hypothetical protein